MTKNFQSHVNFVEQRPYESVPFDEEERDLLTSSGVMYRAKDGRFVFQIVGAVALGRRVIYIIPKFESVSDQSAKTGVVYVQAIKRYLFSGSRRSSMVPTLDDIPLVMRTFEELNSYYVEFGIYKERRHVHISSEVRQTNWPKTIIRNQALFSSIPNQVTPWQSVLYAEPMITTHSSYEGDLSRLYRSVLTLLATFIAPIMRLRHPLESKASIDMVVDAVSVIFGKSNFYKRILRAHIAAESGPRKRMLKVLYNFLSSDNDSLARIFGRRIFVFGISDFDYVWEDAILSVVGAKRGSQELAQPRIASTAIKISSQRADGIIHPEKGDDKVTIIDAKYYFGQDNQPITLGVGDVMKQYGYAVSARASWHRQSIQNVIAFPDSVLCNERATVVGSVKLEKDGIINQSVDPIALVKIRPSEVFEFYSKKTVNTWLKSFLIECSQDTDAIHMARRYKADINKNISQIEVVRKSVVLKAGSKFKTSQTVSRRPPPRGIQFDANWHSAKRLLASLFAKSLLEKEKDSVHLLKSDIECGNLLVATLMISELNPSVPTNIWVEHGVDG